MATRTIRTYAPASVGNFAAGFDLMGAALAPLDGSRLGDIVEATPAVQTTFELTGPQALALAGDSRPNLVLQTFELYQETLWTKGIPCEGMALRLEKHLPVKSGLGSSASSIVATLAALQALYREPLSRAELLLLAGQAEARCAGGAHLDNVAPSLLGGLQLLVPGRRDGPPVLCRELPWPRDLLLAVVHPHLDVSTAEARAILPTHLRMDETLAFAQNLAAFVHALHSMDRALLARCLRDTLAEPRRAVLVPGFGKVQVAALKEGALGCTLSGSGPTMFAVAEGAPRTQAVLEAMIEAFGQAGLACDAHLCGLDLDGAREVS